MKYKTNTDGREWCAGDDDDNQIMKGDTGEAISISI